MSLLRAGVPVARLRVRGASGQSFRLACAGLEERIRSPAVE
jgi:hypothetical protein